MKKIIAVIAAATISMLALTGCTGTSSSYQERVEQQQTITLDSSLEVENLTKRLELQNDPNRIGYLYVMSYAEIIGFYVIQGKVSSSGSQLAPEVEIVDPCGSSYCPTVVDSAQDDGTFGTGDPGIFFFLADGTYVETTLDYIYSTTPLAVDVPRLL